MHDDDGGCIQLFVGEQRGRDLVININYFHKNPLLFGRCATRWRHIHTRNRNLAKLLANRYQIR